MRIVSTRVTDGKDRVAVESGARVRKAMELPEMAAIVGVMYNVGNRGPVSARRETLTSLAQCHFEERQDLHRAAD